MPKPEEKEVLSLISAKASKELKDEFHKKCEEKDLNPSAVIRGMVRLWNDGKIKLGV